MRTFVDPEFLKKKWDLAKEKFRRIRKKIVRSDQPSLALEWPLYPLMFSHFDPYIKTRKYVVITFALFFFHPGGIYLKCFIHFQSSMCC